MYTKALIITIVAIIGVVLAGLFVYWHFTQPTSATPATSTPSTGVQYPTVNTGTTISQPRKQKPAPVDIATQYGVLFNTLSAIPVTFSKVDASSAEFKSVYALYAADIAQYKKLFPAATDFSIDMASLDLNGDGVAEVLVYEDLPGFCGSGGCSFAVYTKKGTGWKSILDTLAEGQVGVSNTATAGYSDLFISLHGEVGYESSVMKFVWGGTQYNQGPAVAQWNGTTFTVTQ